MIGAEMGASPGGELAVCSSTNAGRHWRKKGRRLPSCDAYLLVLREAFSTDECDPAVLYFGSETGQLFYSSKGGRQWQVLANFLPPVLSVETAIL
jgi:hypothetical protein